MLKTYNETHYVRAYVIFQLWTYNKLGMARNVVEEEKPNIPMGTTLPLLKGSFSSVSSGIYWVPLQKAEVGRNGQPQLSQGLCHSHCFGILVLLNHKTQ